METKITLANMSTCHGPLVAVYVRVFVRLWKTSIWQFDQIVIILSVLMYSDHKQDIMWQTLREKDYFPQVDQFRAGGWHW